MALGDGYKKYRDIVAQLIIGALGATVVWLKGPLAWISTKGLEMLMNVVVRPLYDLVERKVVEAPIKKDIDKKIEAVKTAKTEPEINQAIDEMP